MKNFGKRTYRQALGQLVFGGGTPPNSPPTNITLSNQTVPENADLGYEVGTLTATDADVGETFTYALTNDAGSRFYVIGNKLYVLGGLDYETATSHNVTVQATDSKGATFSKSFAITVTNVAETPPAEPLPTGGEVIVPPNVFDNPPIVTSVGGSVKISGKKKPGAGAFVYSIGAPEAGTVYTMIVDPDWSKLTNTGKDAFVGFGFIGADTGSAFELAGVKGNGSTGLNAHTIEGTNFSNGNTHTLTNEGAAANGTVGSNLIHQLEISEDGLTYTYRTGSGSDPATATYTDEIIDESVSSFTRFGVAAYFASGDTGPFVLAISLWTAEAAITPVTWNPADKSSDLTLSGGDLIVTKTSGGGAWDMVRSTLSHSTGQWYFEVRFTTYTGNMVAGVANASQALDNYVGSSGNSAGYSAANQALGFTGGEATVGAFTAGQWIGFLVDLDANTLKARNVSAGGVWPTQGAGLPAALQGTAEVFAALSIVGLNDVGAANFGASAFVGALPPGVHSWDTGQEGATATLNPSDKHADITLSNGNLTATQTANTDLRANVRSNVFRGGGSWYFEAQYGARTSNIIVGLSAPGYNMADYPGQNGQGVGLGSSGGTPYGDYEGDAPAIGEITVGDWVGFWVDLDANTMKVRNITDGVATWVTINFGNPLTSSDTVYVTVCTNDTGDTVTLNFGATAFQGAIPSGANAWKGANP